jgi:hypothetical protein
MGNAPRFPSDLFVTCGRSDQPLLRTSPQPMTITNRRCSRQFGASLGAPVIIELVSYRKS